MRRTLTAFREMPNMIENRPMVLTDGPEMAVMSHMSHILCWALWGDGYN